MNEKFLKVYIQNVTNDKVMTLKIMSVLFPNVLEYKFQKCDVGHFFGNSYYNCPYCNVPEPEQSVVDVVSDYKNDKKSEIEESLDYLRNKETKTKKDRESIQMLEAVLRNFV